MKILLLIVIFCVTASSLCIMPAFTAEKDFSQPLPTQPSETNFEKEIDALLSLPEEKVDIGIAALTLEKEIYPDLDVDVYSALINHTVGRAKVMTNGSTDPAERVRVLNKLLYEIIGIKYTFSDPFGEKNIKVRHLKGVLDSRRGNCVSMPLLYLAIAQRLGYPVQPVLVPTHIFLRYIDPNLKQQNIEASNGGVYITDEQYIRDFHISEKGIKNGAYLRPLSHKELLAVLLSENAVYWGERGDIKRSIKYLERAVQSFPDSAMINNRIGRFYLENSYYFQGEEAKTYIKKSIFYLEKAVDLGLVTLPREDFMKQMNEKAQEEAQRMNNETAQPANQPDRE